jgi:hypothetical protein
MQLDMMSIILLGLQIRWDRATRIGGTQRGAAGWNVAALADQSQTDMIFIFISSIAMK